jgi:hypothetical protein
MVAWLRWKFVTCSFPRDTILLAIMDANRTRIRSLKHPK